MRATRLPLLIVAIFAVALVGCSSSSKTSTPSSSSAGGSSTTTSLPPLPTTAPGDPDQTPNPIPFDVGEIAARSNGWVIGVAHVVRPLHNADLPALPAGQQYVGVDITMTNGGTATVTVDTRKIFGVTDQSGHGHAAISRAKGTSGLDGSYAPGTKKLGRMIFAVPVKKQLLLLLDGPAIHTQRTIFQVDPPNHPAHD